MNLKEFFSKLDELLELPSGTIQSGAKLADLEAWDSVAVISFIAMADSEYGATVPPKRIAECQTVDDLGALVSETAQQAIP
jgi:acyl carrier protein